MNAGGAIQRSINDVTLFYGDSPMMEEEDYLLVNTDVKGYG